VNYSNPIYFKEDLDDEFKKEEFPNTRRPLNESVWRLEYFLEE